MVDPVHIIPNALNAEELQGILEYFEENKIDDVENYARPGYSYESLHNFNCYYTGTEGYGLDNVDARVLPLKSIIDMGKAFFEENYKMKWGLEFKRGFLNCMSEGASLASHSDDNDIYAGKVAEEIHYSALLFLNDPSEYEGGHIEFWDYETEEEYARLRPNAGDFVLFKGSIMHGVDKIISGQRKNYVLFYRDYNPENEIVIDAEKQNELIAENLAIHMERKTYL